MKRKHYSCEEKMKAVELYIKYDCSPSAVIYELGYPSRGRLSKWYQEYLKTGTVSDENEHRSKYTAEQRAEAIKYYLEHGRSVSKTIRALGYPKKTALCDWLKEDLSPEQRKWRCKTGFSMLRYSEEQKQEIVIDYLTKKNTPTELSNKYGIAPTTVYKWRDRYISGEGTVKMPPKKVRKKTENVKELESQIKQLQEQAEALEQQVYQLRLEKDVLEKAAEIIKKDQGISLLTLTNKEKAIVIDTLRMKYSLKELLSVFHMAKSSYCYQVRSIHRIDKYIDIRKIIRKSFLESNGVYGYRRIHCEITSDGSVISEKVVRKLMKEECLIVNSIHKKKYNSYQGEISPEVDNLVNRDFHADIPNKKWLTDITEFHIPAGKIYLSPIIDCFDGLPVSWTIGTHPDAELVNTMLDTAINTLKVNEKPLVHSDRGAHYRWPGWIERMEKAGLTRSMSKKGCSPDNSACEGFFGRVKNEMFYDREWKGVSIDMFIKILDSYIHWYAEKRIKVSLGGLSPLQYRKKLGYIKVG